MADDKLTDRVELAETPNDNDFFYVVDVSDSTDDITGSSKKIKYSNFKNGGGGGGGTGTLEQSLMFAASDETSDLVVDTDLLTFAIPFDITLTDVRAFVVTSPTGANLEVDVLKNGVSILSTNITIDAGENNSESATTPPVISDTSLSKDDVISVDILQIGSTVAGAGLKITLIYEVTINIS